MSGSDSPPPMAEQLKWLVKENARLRAEVDRLRERVEEKQIDCDDLADEYNRRRAAEAELTALQQRVAAERTEAAAQAWDEGCWWGFNRQEPPNADANPYRTAAPATHGFGPIWGNGEYLPGCSRCGLPADHPIHQATPEETTP